MNLTAERTTILDIKKLRIYINFPIEDFEKWCADRADAEGRSGYFEHDDLGDQDNPKQVTEFLFDKYLEENDLDSLAEEYLIDKLNQES